MARPNVDPRRYVSVYMPLEMRAALERLGLDENRSLSSEIVLRLRRSLAQDEKRLKRTA